MGGTTGRVRGRRGTWRRERRKRGSGMKGELRGQEGGEVKRMATLVAQALAKIKHRDPLRLAKQAARRKLS